MPGYPDTRFRSLRHRPELSGALQNNGRGLERQRKQETHFMTKPEDRKSSSNNNFLCCTTENRHGAEAQVLVQVPSPAAMDLLPEEGQASLSNEIAAPTQTDPMPPSQMQNLRCSSVLDQDCAKDSELSVEARLSC